MSMHSSSPSSSSGSRSKVRPTLSLGLLGQVISIDLSLVGLKLGLGLWAGCCAPKEYLLTSE